MKKNIMTRIVSFVVLSAFLLNSTAYGLSPMPGTENPSTQAAIIDMLTASRGECAIDLEVINPGTFVPSEPPSSHIGFAEIELSRDEYYVPSFIGSIMHSLESSGIPQGSLDAEEEYLLKDSPDMVTGELPIFKVLSRKGKKTVVFDKNFVAMYHDIAKKGLRLKLKSMGLAPLSLRLDGQIFKRVLDKLTGRQEEGDWIGEGIWMWFLHSYCLNNATRYDNNKLEERLHWVFESAEAKKLNLDSEFRSAKSYPALRQKAIELALFINYCFYSPRAERLSDGAGLLQASRESAKIAIALSPSIKKLLEKQGSFTLQDFLTGRKEVAGEHPEFNWTPISEDQAQKDLKSLSVDDGTGKMTTAIVTIIGMGQYSLTYNGTNTIADLELNFLKKKTARAALIGEPEQVPGTRIFRADGNTPKDPHEIAAQRQADTEAAKQAAAVIVVMSTGTLQSSNMPLLLGKGLARLRYPLPATYHKAGKVNTAREMLINEVFGKLSAIQSNTPLSALSRTQRLKPGDIIIAEKNAEKSFYICFEEDGPFSTAFIVIDNAGLHFFTGGSEPAKFLEGYHTVLLSISDIDLDRLEPMLKRAQALVLERDSLISEEAQSVAKESDLTEDAIGNIAIPEQSLSLESMESSLRQLTEERARIKEDGRGTTAIDERIDHIINQIQEMRRDEALMLAAANTGLDEHPLIKAIMESMIASNAPHTGPGSVRLTIEEVRSLYETVKLVNNTRIKIIQAQAEIGLSQTMQDALRNIKGGRDAVDCKLFSNAESLKDLLQPEEGVMKIVLTAGGRSVDIVSQLAQKEPELFANVRSLNMDLPAGYEKWAADSKERTFYQARMAMVAIFARLYQPDKTPMVELILRRMLQGHIGDYAVDKFLNDLVESKEESGDSISQRIQNCLNRLVSLVEETGEKIEHLKLEMKTFWTAA